MEDSKHLRIKDLLLFSRGLIRDDKKLQSIADHLANCSTCFEKLEQFEFIMRSRENFDIVWDSCFPHIKVESSVGYRIAGWIDVAVSKADEKIKYELRKFKQWITDHVEELNVGLIPVVQAVRGESGESSIKEESVTGNRGFIHIDDLIIYSDKKVDMDMFDDQEFLNGELSFRSKKDPGFSKAFLVQSDGSYFISGLKKMDKYYCFIFTGISSDECFISFE